MYNPRTKKSLLPFNSAHSKLIKRAIASNSLEAALVKSRDHLMQASFQLQVTLLTSSGYPQHLIAGVSESLLQKLKKTGKKQLLQDKEKKKLPIQAIPYIHKVSHNIKKIAARNDVGVVFSAPGKLSKLCPMLHQRKRPACTMRHAIRYTGCKKQVTYEIPLTCGRVYIGQMERCFNERAREHALTIRNSAGGNLLEHCKRCDRKKQCGRKKERKPLLQKTRFLACAVTELKGKSLKCSS